jgi:hypothetical protein
MSKLEFADTATKVVERPSKWDIIPIHSSDRASFKFCRRAWKWSSPNQFNLVPLASVYGVDKNLWFGTGIHYALERYYNPVIQEPPNIAWETWFDLQWKGGIVTEDEVKQFADRNPQIVAKRWDTSEQEAQDRGGNYYQVDGLCDIIPDSALNEELFMGMRDMGVGMMKFYKEYSEEHDNFRVILTEHDFSVPVLDEEGKVYYAVDNRKMPDEWAQEFEGRDIPENVFGPLWREGWSDSSSNYVLEKQVHVRGRMDIIIQELEHGRYGIRDYKTTAKLDEDYFRHMELDEQTTSYLTFGQIEAKLFDLEYSELEFIDYVGLYKGYPKPPTVLKSGLPSLSRTTETTTAQMFEKFVVDNGLKPIYDIDPKMQNYYTWLLETGEKRYINIKTEWRNRHQRWNAMIRLNYEARDMLSDPVPYPNPTKNYSCLNCRFRTPCIQAESGDDYQQTLEDGYVPNWDR